MADQVTAQVAVFNERCVAAASDSTVTIGQGQRRRTIQTADKMFDLGDGHLVVVLASGSASFMGVPFDVVLEEWRSTLTRPLPAVADYAAAFVDWLTGNRVLFDTDRQNDLLDWLVTDMYLTIRADLIDELRSGGLQDMPWDDVSVHGRVDCVVEEWVDRLSGREDLPGLDPDRDREYLAQRTDPIRNAFDYVFDDVPRTVRSDQVLLGTVPPLVMSKAEPWSIDTTVAFVGYGQSEVFPGHQVIEVTGIVNDRVLLDQWEPGAVSHGNRSLVSPFAQSEAIHTFLRAYNADFLNLAQQRLESALNAAWGHEPGDDDEEQESLRADAHQGLIDDFDRLSWEQFVSPMLTTVESLPRPDMARLAESLVGLQALRAASSAEQPTVGGPIDVVLISRDAGVRWVRRKDGA